MVRQYQNDLHADLHADMSNVRQQTLRLESEIQSG